MWIVHFGIHISFNISELQRHPDHHPLLLSIAKKNV